MHVQQSIQRLLGIAAIIVLVVSGLIYSRYGYSMLFPVDGEFVNHIGDIAGGDFLVFYNAAVMTVKGSAGAVWDPPAFDAHLLKIYGQKIDQLHFFNPPVALLIWAPLGFLKHSHALWLWTALPLVTLGWLIYRLTGSLLATGLTLIAPLTAYSAGAGQTGIVYAALMAGFLLCHQRYPARAGSIAALVAIKPHLALAMPFCLLIDRNWRALLSMAITAVVLVALASLIFGFGIWGSFVEGIRYHSGEFFHAANPSFDRTPSVLMLALKLGAGDTVAWTAQVMCSLATLGLLALIWRSANDLVHQAFALALAICLLTPKIMHYDAMVLLVPIAMLTPRIERRTADVGLVILSILIWCLPFLEPGFRAIGYHPGALVFFAGLVFVAVRSQPLAVNQTATGSL